MDNDTSLNSSTMIELTTEIVVAYVANNRIDAGGLGALISAVHGTLVQLGEPAPEAKPVPAANPKKTIFPDHIISLEDGKSYKSMKRHLSVRGLTPADYRAKWGLPADYPMVAANYSAARSELAKTIGLGRKAKATVKAKKKLARA